MRDRAPKARLFITEFHGERLAGKAEFHGAAIENSEQILDPRMLSQVARSPFRGPG